MTDQRWIGPFSDDSTIPPPPDGSTVVPVETQQGQSQATNIPPPPDGSGIAPTDNSTAVTGGDVAQFSDDPSRVLSHMTPEQEQAYTQLLHNGSADQIQTFLHGIGASSDAGKLQAFVAGRDHAKQVGGPVNYDVSYALAPAPFGDDGQAAVRGGLQGLTLGTNDELHGVAKGLESAIHGDGFTDAYDRAVDSARAQLGYDEQNHGIQSFLGNIAGGLLLPVGLEKAGVTASIRSVGLAARDAAIAEGLAPAAADRVAARAITHRLAAEGAAYGGAYGAGTSEGGARERLVGGVEGGLTGAALGVATPYVGKALGATGRAIGRGYEALSQPFTASGAQRQASRVLTGSALRPIKDIVNDLANRPEAVPGSQPTLGEVANDSGLAGLQRGIANSSKDASGPISERYAQNAIARTAYADDALGAGNPQAIQDVAASRVADAESQTAAQQASRAAAAEQRLADNRNAATAARDTAAQTVASARESVGPIADRADGGAATREQYQERYTAAKKATREAYANPELMAETPVSIPKPVFDDILATAHDFYGNHGGEISNPVQHIIEDAADSTTTTRSLSNIDRRLADVAGAARTAGRNQEAAFAESVRNRIDQYASEATTPEYRNALSAAKAARAEQGRIFERGFVGRTFGEKRSGEPNVSDSSLASRVAQPGASGGSATDGLIAALGPDNAEQAVRQELRRTVDEAGVTTEAQARAIVTRYGETAKRFPSVQADLNALVNHTASLDAASVAAREADRATVTAAERAHINELSAAELAIKKSPLSRIANPDRDPASFVGELLRRSDNGRTLKRLASDVSNNPDAVAGLRRSFGQFIVNAGTGARNTAAGDDIPALAATRKAIGTITTRAGDLLTSQQKMALQRVGRELKATNFAMYAGRPSGSDTSQNEAYKMALHFLPIPGAKTATSVYSVLASAFTNRQQVQNLLTQAVLDPDFAANLLKRATPQHLERARTQLLGRKALVTSTLIGQSAMGQR